MRIFRLLLALGLVALTVGFGPGHIAGATPTTPAASAPVDRQVWSDLAAASGHRVRFVVSMREAPGGGAASAIPAQMALEEPLAVLRRVGTVASFMAYYGANAIVVEGGPGAVRFLAEWPEVATIGSYRAGSPWEVARAAEAPAATGHITGQVTGPDGTTPLQNIRVRAFLWTGGSNWQLVAWADTGADGRYDIGGLATGYYRAEFNDLAGSYVTEYYDNKADFNLADAFYVTDGGTTANINASLAQAGRISGTVIAASGGAKLELIVASACQVSGGACPILGSGVTGADGKYTIVGLPPGTYRVRFADSYPVPRYMPQYYNGQVDPNLATPVAVTAGQTTPNINASMGSYGKITGKVSGPDGTTALAGITADIWKYNAAVQDWEWISSGSTDTSGNYDAFGLVTGDYRLEFSDPTGYYVTEFYNNKPNMESADNVHVNLGYAISNINASLALVVTTFTQTVVSGWNLIALPLTAADPAPAVALATISGSYDLVYAYAGCDAADPWKMYDPNAPPFVSDLTALNVKQGYWLRAIAPASLVLTGTPMPSASISLCAGWNLIGYPSETAKPVTTALAGIAGKYDLVYAYYAGDAADPWKMYDPNAPPFVSDLTTMQRGVGYWIRMTQAATLTITNRVPVR